jgi:hypothetical protein
MGITKLVEDLMGVVGEGDIELKQRQAEIIQSVNNTASIDILGQTMTQ